MDKRDEALSLARDFEREGFSMPDLYERFWRLQGDAAAYFTLADSLLRGQRDGATLLKDALGYVGEEDFKALIATAVQILREEAAEERETQRNENAAQTGENARSARADEIASKSARKERGRDKKSARWKSAEEVIAMSSLECAPFLRPYLAELFDLQPSESAYYAEYPWRELSYEDSRFWRERLVNPQTSKDERQKIFSCLLQTREPRNVKFACEIALAQDFFDRPCDLLEYIGYWLEPVGFTFERAKFDDAAGGQDGAGKFESPDENVSEPGSARKENTNAAGKNEICSDADKLNGASESGAGEISKTGADEGSGRQANGYGSEARASENLEASGCGKDAQRAQASGSDENGECVKRDEICKFKASGADDENNPLFHLVTFDPMPQGLCVRSLRRLVLAAHVREASEGEILFYEHDESGVPRRIGEKTAVEYAYDEPIKECEITLAPTPARWAAQDWGLSNSRQNLARIGGEPSWIQGAWVPSCPLCGEKMEFLMQLDSELPGAEGGELLFGSGGILYAFWCERSRVSAFFMQCT